MKINQKSNELNNLSFALTIKDYLNKIHYKKSDNAKSVYNCKEIIEIFSSFIELAELSCKNTYGGNKKNYQECKKLNTEKDLVQTSFYEACKINNY